MAGGVGSGAARLPAPPDGRGQRGRASEVAAAAPRDYVAGDQREAGPGNLAAGVLCGVRRSAQEAGDRQGAGGGVGETASQQVSESADLENLPVRSFNS